MIAKALACAAIIVSTPAAATNVLHNSGFETGSLSPWYQGNDFSFGVDWTVTTTGCQSGTFCAENTGNKELRQDFAGVLGSTINQVSFWARHPKYNTDDALAYSFYYSDSTNAEFLVFLTGYDWNFFDVTAQLDPTKTLVGFSIYGTSLGDFLLNQPVTLADNFLINVGDINVADDGVPEPGTWATILLGFGAAGLMLRRRRRVSAALA
jgi:hypothetical protein